jgi:hypothetical protein
MHADKSACLWPVTTNAILQELASFALIGYLLKEV